MNELTKEQREAKKQIEQMFAMQFAIEAEECRERCINYPDCDECDCDCEEFSNDN